MRENLQTLRSAPETPKAGVEAKYLLSFQEFTKEDIAGVREALGDLEPPLQRFKATHMDVIKSNAAQAWTKLQEMSDRLKDRLINVKAICKDVDGNLGDLIEFPQRQELVDDLKKFTGMLAQFVKFKDCLACVGVKDVPGSCAVTGYNDFVTLRQSARLQRVARSAALIIQKNRAADIDSLDLQAKQLKVVLPKPLRSKVDSLKP